MHVHELNPKRTAITLLIFTAVIIIGLITLKSPRLKFEQDVSKTLEMIEWDEGCVYPYEIADVIDGKVDTVLLVDLRNTFEFAKGNIPGSENISSVELLNEENIDRLNELKAKNICVVVYANDQLEANGPWMILRQLGFDNVKLLLGGYDYYKKWEGKLADSYGDDALLRGAPKFDYKEFANSSKVVGSETSSKRSTVKIARKKKTSVAEGGC
jgi:rhodanese-related sulfurtransferase